MAKERARILTGCWDKRAPNLSFLARLMFFCCSLCCSLQHYSSDYLRYFSLYLHDACISNGSASFAATPVILRCCFFIVFATNICVINLFAFQQIFNTNRITAKLSFSSIPTMQTLFIEAKIHIHHTSTASISSSFDYQ